MTVGRPSDWANAQAGPYSVEGGPRQQPPIAPPTPYSPAPHASPYAPPQPYVPPHASPYAPPQPYVPPHASPYAPPYQNPYSPGIPYQQPQAYGYMSFTRRPEAPSANTAMVLGIISLAVGLLLCTPVGLLGIAAVITGNRAKREIRESRNYLDGQSKVTTALITGWIAIVVGVLGVLLLIAIFSNSDFTSTL